MDAFISGIAIMLKERGYVFNDLVVIPVPKEDQYVLLEIIKSWEVYITKTDNKEPLRLVKINKKYFKLT